jgi:hypothetical protein
VPGNCGIFAALSPKKFRMLELGGVTLRSGWNAYNCSVLH